MISSFCNKTRETRLDWMIGKVNDRNWLSSSLSLYQWEFLMKIWRKISKKKMKQYIWLMPFFCVTERLTTRLSRLAAQIVNRRLVIYQSEKKGTQRFDHSSFFLFLSFEISIVPTRHAIHQFLIKNEWF